MISPIHDNAFAQSLTHIHYASTHSAFHGYRFFCIQLALHLDYDAFHDDSGNERGQLSKCPNNQPVQPSFNDIPKKYSDTPIAYPLLHITLHILSYFIRIVSAQQWKMPQRSCRVFWKFIISVLLCGQHRFELHCSVY